MARMIYSTMCILMFESFDVMSPLNRLNILCRYIYVSSVFLLLLLVTMDHKL